MNYKRTIKRKPKINFCCTNLRFTSVLYFEWKFASIPLVAYTLYWLLDNFWTLVGSTCYLHFHSLLFVSCFFFFLDKNERNKSAVFLISIRSSSQNEIGIFVLNSCLLILKMSNRNLSTWTYFYTRVRTHIRIYMYIHVNNELGKHGNKV